MATTPKWASLLIGRIVDWKLLGNIETVEVDRETFTLNGRVTVGENEIPKARALRDQIVGLTDSNEAFVPLRVNADPTLDGMVKVRSASATLEPGSFVRGWFPWRITVDRVPGGALPNVESPLIGGYRTNIGRSASDVVPWHAVPAAALDYYDGASAFQSVGSVLATETGPVRYYQFAPGVGRRTARYTIPPANWYDGAALIEQAYPDGNYYGVIGRLMYSGLSSTGWRLGNGIVRIRPGTTAGSLDLQMWNGTAWGVVHTFVLGAYDGVTPYTANRINTVSVLKNSPEECRVRLTVGLTSGGIDYPQRTILDLRLRRGARVVECRWSTFGTAMLGKVGPLVGEAGTAMASTLGGFTTTADADGNTAFIVSQTAGSFSTGSSMFDITSTPLLAWSFGLGIIKGGGSAVAPWRYIDLRDEYLAPYGERMTVVGW